jgi:hypothetical protein
MLISRGPVYKTADRAGQSPAGVPEELMTRWHPNCDCKVVPVFDIFNWPGRDQYLYYENLWAEVTKGYAGGKNGGDKLKVFRSHLESNPETFTRRLAA